VDLKHQSSKVQHLIQRKSFQKGWIPFVASNLQIFTLEALIGLLEEREQCPSIEGNPQLATQVFGLKEIQEDLDRRQKVELCAKNNEASNERPTIWV